jgi:hypothetical protein
MLLSYADNQRFQRLVDCGTLWRLPLLGVAKLLYDQGAVPAEHRLGLDDLSHSREALLAQLLAAHGEGLARHHSAGCDLGAGGEGCGVPASDIHGAIAVPDQRSPS